MHDTASQTWDSAWSIDVDVCWSSWVVGVNYDWIDLGIVSAAFGPLRINITWPI